MTTSLKYERCKIAMKWQGIVGGWYEMVYDGMGWYGMVYDGIEWYMMVWDCVSWYEMV